MFAMSPNRGEVGPIIHVGVHHPTEERLVELGVLRRALSRGDDAPLNAELRTSPPLLCDSRALPLAWKAEIHMQVPLRRAERDPRIERLERGPLGHRVHGPAQSQLPG